MSVAATIALWKHRYRKYSYIAKECLGAVGEIIRFLLLKISFLGRRKLIAIIRTEHFGDIVAAEPLARQIREIHPKDYIVWMVKPVFKELVVHHPAVDEAWAQPSVLRRLVLCKSGVFDKIYNLEFWQSNFDLVSGQVHKNEVAAQKDITVFNYFEKGNLLTIFQLCADLPIRDDAPRLIISKADEEKIKSLGLPHNLVVIHCSSNYPAKDWSVENWQKLVDWLINERGYYVAQIGLKAIQLTENPKYLDLCGKFTILQTAEIIKHATYFIGIDSGPAHLANAVGTFGVLLFGKLNNFDHYMPYSGTYQNGKNALIISDTNKTCAELGYQLVQTQLETLMTGSQKKTLSM